MEENARVKTGVKRKKAGKGKNARACAIEKTWRRARISSCVIGYVPFQEVTEWNPAELHPECDFEGVKIQCVRKKKGRGTGDARERREGRVPGVRLAVDPRPGVFEGEKRCLNNQVNQ